MLWRDLRVFRMSEVCSLLSDEPRENELGISERGEITCLRKNRTNWHRVGRKGAA